MSYAKKYATSKHKKIGQMYDDKEYDFHLTEVALIVRREKHHYPKHITKEPNFLHAVFSDASWLHDVVEDTDTTYEDLLNNFDKETADIVMLVTDSKDEKLSRKEKKSLMNKKFSTYDESEFVYWAALVLKAIDRFVNYRYSINTKNKSKIKMYYKEYVDFRKAVWREGIAIGVWREMDKLDRFVSENYNFSR